LSVPLSVAACPLCWALLTLSTAPCELQIKEQYWAKEEETTSSSAASGASASGGASSSAVAAGANSTPGINDGAASSGSSTLSTGAIGGIVAAAVVAALAALGWIVRLVPASRHRFASGTDRLAPPPQAFALIKRRKARAAGINEKSGWYAQTDNPEDDPWTAPANRAWFAA
jgi:hypothetical protein